VAETQGFIAAPGVYRDLPLGGLDQDGALVVANSSRGRLPGQPPVCPIGVNYGDQRSLPGRAEMAADLGLGSWGRTTSAG